MSPDELRDIARNEITVGLEASNKAIGLGRTYGYSLAKQGTYPVAVLRLGTRYRVRTADLLAFLGITPETPVATPPRPPLAAASNTQKEVRRFDDKPTPRPAA